MRCCPFWGTPPSKELSLCRADGCRPAAWRCTSAICGPPHPPPPFDLLMCSREVALEEFEDFTNVADGVFVRIANIPLQESLRDLR